MNTPSLWRVTKEHNYTLTHCFFVWSLLATDASHRGGESMQLSGHWFILWLLWISSPFMVRLKRSWGGDRIRTTESERKTEWKNQFWHHFNHTEEEIKGASITRNRWEEWRSVWPDQRIITGDHRGDGDKDVKWLKQR